MSSPLEGPARAIAVIPARGGSKRLPRKNVVPVLGKPLIQWTVEAALASRWLGSGNVFVSTEDDEIAAAAREAGAGVIRRPPELAGDAVWTEPVIEHAAQSVESESGPLGLVAWMNACVPELTADDIDRAFDRLRDERLREVVSVDMGGRSNSAIRVLRREVLGQGRLSVVFAVERLDYLDVHTIDDIAAVEARLRQRAVR